jgi:hypothetical protein
LLSALDLKDRKSYLLLLSEDCVQGAVSTVPDQDSQGEPIMKRIAFVAAVLAITACTEKTQEAAPAAAAPAPALDTTMKMDSSKSKTTTTTTTTTTTKADSSKKAPAKKP